MMTEERLLATYGVKVPCMIAYGSLSEGLVFVGPFNHIEEITAYLNDGREKPNPKFFMQIYPPQGDVVWP